MIVNRRREGDIPEQLPAHSENCKQQTSGGVGRKQSCSEKLTQDTLGFVTLGMGFVGDLGYKMRFGQNLGWEMGF